MQNLLGIAERVRGWLTPFGEEPWTTPIANEAEKRGDHHGGLRGQVVGAWSTPTGDDANNVTRESGAFQSLTRSAQTWATPHAFDHIEVVRKPEERSAALVWLREAALDGVDCTIVDLDWRGKEEGSYRQKLWIGNNDYLIRKSVFTDKRTLEQVKRSVPKGWRFPIEPLDATLTIHYTKLQANPEIDPATFDLPAGSKIERAPH